MKGYDAPSFATAADLQCRDGFADLKGTWHED